MSKIRYLKILFDKNIQAYEVSQFRGAVIAKTKGMSNLFHNHLDDKEFIYRYPLIQYKIQNKKPCIICLKEATEDIHYLLKERDYRFKIGDRQLDMTIEDVRLKYENIQTWEKQFKYNIHNYMALNQENFEKYQACESLVEKLALLEELLYKHILIFATEMGSHMPVDLKVNIIELKGEKYIEYKNIFHLTFSLNFKTNLTIPNYVGIGKGTSLGFGIVKKLSDG